MPMFFRKKPTEAAGWTAEPCDNRYHLIDRIGEGGSSEIFSTVDGRMNRVVALKVLKAENLERKDLVDLFVNEAKLLGFIEHPGVVPVYNTFSYQDGRPCYSMKLLEGRRLTDLLDRRRGGAGTELTSIEAFRIFTKICETMAFVHAKGVIHLDLKPANIMIGSFGEVLVMDWGNARIFDEGPYRAYLGKFTDRMGLAQFVSPSSEMIVGTPGYMSPEQTEVSRSELGPTSDVFSAGVLLYEMMAGLNPFDAEETAAVLEKTRTYAPPPVHELNPDVPLRLSQICGRMMEKNPSRRYAGFAEVLADLSALNLSGQAFPVLELQPGEMIFHEGEQGDYAFSVLSGSIEISKRVHGRSHVLAVLGKGEVVGELAIIRHQPRTATARALELSRIRVLSRADVESELQKLAPWVGDMINCLADRFISLNQKVALHEMDDLDLPSLD